jgi:hypothetical protein
MNSFTKGETDIGDVEDALAEENKNNAWNKKQPHVISVECAGTSVHELLIAPEK